MKRLFFALMFILASSAAQAIDNGESLVNLLSQYETTGLDGCSVTFDNSSGLVQVIGIDGQKVSREMDGLDFSGLTITADGSNYDADVELTIIPSYYNLKVLFVRKDRELGPNKVAYCQLWRLENK